MIREQLATSGFIPSARVGSELDDDGNPKFNLNDPLLKIATHVKVAERSSKREIKRLFTYLREENGWDVRTVLKPEKQKKDKKFAEAGKDVNETRNAIFATNHIAKTVDFRSDRNAGLEMANDAKHIDDRLGAQAGNGCAADMLDAQKASRKCHE